MVLFEAVESRKLFQNLLLRGFADFTSEEGFIDHWVDFFGWIIVIFTNLFDPLAFDVIATDLYKSWKPSQARKHYENTRSEPEINVNALEFAMKALWNYEPRQNYG